jgi:hypothetical protein
LTHRPSHREQTIVTMLRRYSEAQETLNGPSGIRGTGECGFEMPGTWNRSYRELDRCLAVLREKMPSKYCHLRARYLTPESVHITVTATKGKLRLPPHTELAAGAPTAGEKTARVRVYRWPQWVREEKVRVSVTFLSDTFRGEPYLPEEFLEVA